MRRRILAVALTVLVIMSAVPAGPVGTAAADITSPSFVDCSGLEEDPSRVFLGAIGVFSACSLDLGSGDVAEDLEAADANETKTELYGSLSSVKEQSENGNISMQNQLTMTRTIGRMEAKNAYIRSLNNDTSEATARNDAHDAVENFIASREMEVLNRWTVQMQELERALGHAKADSGVTAHEFIRANVTDGNFNSQYVNGIAVNQTANVTLANGSTETVPALWVAGSTSSGSTVYSNSFGPEEGYGLHTSSTPYLYINDLTVQEPYADFGSSPFEYLTISNPNRDSGYRTQLDELDQQHQALDADVNDYVNGTYDQWEAGKINSSDLIDPYQAAREHSPSEDFQSWALLSLQMAGSQSVDNMSQFGHMEVTDLETGAQYRGIVMSDGVPQGGQFDANATYNASKIAGPQYVVTDSNIHEFDGEFSVGKMQTADGETIQNVTYTNITYQSNNLTAYKQRIDTLNAQIEEINERQDKLRGGGPLFGDLFGGGGAGMLFVVAGVAVVGYLLVAGGGGGGALLAANQARKRGDRRRRRGR